LMGSRYVPVHETNIIQYLLLCSKQGTGRFRSAGDA